MKTLILKENTKDKDTKEIYEKGSEKSFTNERAQELIDAGVAVEATPKAEKELKAELQTKEEKHAAPETK